VTECARLLLTNNLPRSSPLSSSSRVFYPAAPNRGQIPSRRCGLRLPGDAVCCSVLQVCCNERCVAVRCSAMRYSAVHVRMLQYVAVCCSVLQCVAVRCSALQCAIVSCYLSGAPSPASFVLQSTAACCSVLQRVAVCYCELQWVALHHGVSCASLALWRSALLCVAECCSVSWSTGITPLWASPCFKYSCVGFFLILCFFLHCFLCVYK